MIVMKDKNDNFIIIPIDSTTAEVVIKLKRDDAIQLADLLNECLAEDIKIIEKSIQEQFNQYKNDKIS